MKILSWEEFVSGALASRPFAATIGVFDGLHIGHRRLISRVVGREGLDSAVFTFRENPKRILSPRTHQGELSTLGQKLDLIASLSVDFCVLIDFSGDFSKLPGRSFLAILRDSGRLRFLAVGEDFRCGRRLDTSSADIRAFCEESSVGVELVPALRWGDQAVSSSRIRKAVTEGRLEDAATMLGRPYEIDLRRASPDAAGRWSPEDAQASPPKGSYEALIVPGPGAGVFGARARLDAGGTWTISGNSRDAEGHGFGALAVQGLGLIKLVSRE